MDKILIKGLESFACVGVPAEERKHPQRILMDLEMELDLEKAGRLDDVAHTLDYARVVEEIQVFLQGRSFRLVEALAHQVAHRVMDRFSPERVRLRVRKFSVPGTQSVGVEVARVKRGGRSRTTSGSPRT